MPDSTFYGDFLQLENGVGMWAMLKSECEEALDDYNSPEETRNITLVTGESAYPLLSNIVDNVAKKWHNFKCNVVAIKNNFFGGKITANFRECHAQTISVKYLGVFVCNGLNYCIRL